MKPNFLKLTLAALVLLLGGSSLQAIKITIPDQYEEEVKVINEAEKAKVESQLDASEDGDNQPAEPQDGMQFSSGEDSENGLGAPSDEKPEVSEPLAQSIDEANKTAGEFEQTIPEGQGFVSGQIVDKETKQPLSGVAILIEGTEVGTITDSEGRYTLGPAPAGDYTVNFFKSGYIEANVTDFAVVADEVSVFPFALPPRPTEMSDDVYVLQDFSVSAEEANDMMLKLDIRMDSDSIMNVMSAEDFSKFAAGDVGEAIKRVAGITVEGGQFAVIRGLDERYSSTLLNGAPVSSPDPDRQSVPLDLFPSDVVSNLTVAKTFSPELPGNSAGGSINILTDFYPEEWTLSVTGKGGFNDNAEDRFLGDGGRNVATIDFDDLGSNDTDDLVAPSGSVAPAFEDAGTERDIALEGGGRFEWLGRTIRLFGSVSNEIDYSSRFGSEENRFARGGAVRVAGPNPVILQTGDLSKGQLPFTNGAFDVTQSEVQERTTYLFSTEADLDEEGAHRLSGTYFKTENEDTFASLRDNGVFPGKTTGRQIREETGVLGLFNFFQEDRGGLDEFLTTRFFRVSQVETERDLEVYQLSGSHDDFTFSSGPDFLENLSASWMLSQAEAEQVENDAFTAGGMEFEDGTYLTGQQNQFRDFQPTRGWRRIHEEQDFARLDAKYKHEFSDNLVFTASAGGSVEETERSTDQLFLELGFKTFSSVNPASTIGEAIQDAFSNQRTGSARPEAQAEGERSVESFYAGGKLTFWDKIDLNGGLRFESFQMSTGTNVGSDAFFNSDILRDTDNDPTNSSTPTQAKLNTQILGINGGRPLSPDFEGEIEEDLALPSLSLSYRPFDGLRATVAYSETNVRPSFKEFTFITVRDPVTLDFETGNPALVTSDVESFDFRVEYNWNEGDLVAISLFHKNISNPIEKMTLAGSEAADIFFNNPNDATVQGVEFEFRKKLDFFGPDFLRYFSLGGNIALIDASVDVPQSVQDLLSGGFGYDSNLDGTPNQTVGGGAGAVDGQADGGDDRFESPPSERQLFQQPEWIVNADISFEQPEWGTSATLSWFGQSEVLDTAGGFVDSTNSNVPDLATVDEFQKSFFELNFTLSQRITDHISIGFTMENITDSVRGIEYDDSVGGGDRRSFRVGRDYSLSITGTF